LVGRVIQQLDYIDRAVVSTDSPEIARIAKESGLDVPFMRPESISGDIVSDWEVLHHALMATEEDAAETYDIIVMLQPTSPFRKPEHITMAIEKLIDGNYDAVWTLSEIDPKNHPYKQLIFEKDQVRYYDNQGAQIVARQQLSHTYYRNGAAYAISRNCLVNLKSIQGQKTTAIIIDEPMINIDTEFDFKLAEYFLKNKFEDENIINS